MDKASLGQHPIFNKFLIEQDDDVHVSKDVEDKLCATYFVTFADPVRFGGLWESLADSTLLGRDDYPSNITAAYDLLSHYKGAKRQHSNDQQINISFAQVQQSKADMSPVPGTMEKRCRP